MSRLATRLFRRTPAATALIAVAATAAPQELGANPKRTFNNVSSKLKTV